jgi:hypothetical protein
MTNNYAAFLAYVGEAVGGPISYLNFDALFVPITSSIEDTEIDGHFAF